MRHDTKDAPKTHVFGCFVVGSGMLFASVSMTSVTPHLLSTLTSAFTVAFASVKHGLGYASKHTGIPISVVTALVLVVSWRLLRRSLGFAVELAIALAFVLAATRLGWITW